jgi:hypothetical protein
MHYSNPIKYERQMRQTKEEQRFPSTSINLDSKVSGSIPENKLDEGEYSRRLKRFDNYKAFDTSCFSR